MNPLSSIHSKIIIPTKHHYHIDLNPGKLLIEATFQEKHATHESLNCSRLEGDYEERRLKHGLIEGNNGADLQSSESKFARVTVVPKYTGWYEQLKRAMMCEKLGMIYSHHPYHLHHHNLCNSEGNAAIQGENELIEQSPSRFDDMHPLLKDVSDNRPNIVRNVPSVPCTMNNNDKFDSNVDTVANTVGVKNMRESITPTNLQMNHRVLRFSDQVEALFQSIYSSHTPINSNNSDTALRKSSNECFSSNEKRYIRKGPFQSTLDDIIAKLDPDPSQNRLFTSIPWWLEASADPKLQIFLQFVALLRQYFWFIDVFPKSQRITYNIIWIQNALKLSLRIFEYCRQTINKVNRDDFSNKNIQYRSDLERNSKDFQQDIQPSLEHSFHTVYHGTHLQGTDEKSFPDSQNMQYLERLHRSIQEKRQKLKDQSKVNNNNSPLLDKNANVEDSHYRYQDYHQFYQKVLLKNYQMTHYVDSK